MKYIIYIALSVTVGVLLGNTLSDIIMITAIMLVIIAGIVMAQDK